MYNLRFLTTQNASKMSFLFERRKNNVKKSKKWNFSIYFFEKRNEIWPLQNQNGLKIVKNREIFKYLNFKNKIYLKPTKKLSKIASKSHFWPQFSKKYTPIINKNMKKT